MDFPEAHSTLSPSFPIPRNGVLSALYMAIDREMNLGQKRRKNETRTFQETKDTMVHCGANYEVASHPGVGFGVGLFD